ncbi:MAG: Ig-like domain-containing protein, partial [Acidobacteriota bacterium]
FNPPSGSYPEAAGQGTPPGADGAQAAFLFNNSGPAAAVSARQDLGDVAVLEPNRDYALRVAIGKFDTAQPYPFSLYGGYRIELLAGDTALGVDQDSVDPQPLTFEDATLIVSADSVPPELYGEPLAVRLSLSQAAAQRSTHFDDVRLEWSSRDGGTNQPPSARLVAPADGSTWTLGDILTLAASASDTDGEIERVSFFTGGTLLGEDLEAPFELPWTPPAEGVYSLSAVAEDDAGSTTSSAVVSITVEAPVTSGTVAVINPSFELPALADGRTRDNSGIPGWTFSGSAGTFRGVFNPPSGSYPEAAGQGTPLGADGAQAAFLFNNAGPAAAVSARQDLGESLVAGRDYTLTVAIGRFNTEQPYPFSLFGGYRIELLAGDTVLAADVDTVDPPSEAFADAVLSVEASSVPPSLVGRPLAIRLLLGSSAAQRSTHFDRVRLEWATAP